MLYEEFKYEKKFFDVTGIKYHDSERRLFRSGNPIFFAIPRTGGKFAGIGGRRSRQTLFLERHTH